MDYGWAGLAVGAGLGLVLVVAAVLKLANPRATQAAMATFGIRGPRMERAVWVAVVSAELALAVGVAAGLAVAAYCAAGLMAAFALAQAVALRRGRAGAPCGCFGPRSRVGWPGIARNGCLAVLLASLPLLPRAEPSTDEWLAIGLGVALLACAALAVIVLSLAREVGMLRLRLGPQSALEIPEEGPELGSRSRIIEAFDPRPPASLALAVFFSEGCHMCRALEPAVTALGREPFVALEMFEEAADAAVWQDLDVPGSPYAVALDLDGTVLAKGTFNNLDQLESVLATADRRRTQTEGRVHA